MRGTRHPLEDALLVADSGAEIALTTGTGRLVYLSPVPWSSFAQRPHFLVQDYVERTGGRVLWIDPYPGRLPRIEDFRRRRPLIQPVRQQQSDLIRSVRVLQPRALPVEPLPGVNALNQLLWRSMVKTIREFTSDRSWLLGIGRPSRLSLRLLEELLPTVSFYDAMDDFPEFYSGLSRAVSMKLEERITGMVDRIVVSAAGLEAKFEHAARKVSLARNGCDPASLPAPAKRTGRRPVFGYIGTVGRWFDWGKVLKLAGDLSEADVELVGPVFGKLPSNLPANMRLHGPCSQDQVGLRLSTFSVGIIPFAINDLTRSVDPIKYYEYRAMGLPVLSTPFGEMPWHAERDSGVFLFERDGSLRTSATRALAHQDEVSWVEEFRRNHAWSSRFAVLEDIYSSDG